MTVRATCSVWGNSVQAHDKRRSGKLAASSSLLRSLANIALALRVKSLGNVSNALLEDPLLFIDHCKLRRDGHCLRTPSFPMPWSYPCTRSTSGCCSASLTPERRSAHGAFPSALRRPISAMPDMRTCLITACIWHMVSQDAAAALRMIAALMAPFDRG